MDENFESVSAALRADAPTCPECGNTDTHRDILIGNARCSKCKWMGPNPVPR